MLTTLLLQPLKHLKPMGSKANPVGLRTGIIRRWQSSWYANRRDFGKVLKEDLAIRKFIAKAMPDSGIAGVELHRNAKDISIQIHSAKPGVIIGRQGAGVDTVKENLEKAFGHRFTINVIEIKKPELYAALIADNIKTQIERRVSYRRAAKMSVKKAIETGAKGVKIRVSGRLNGVEIARSEFYSEGQIPLHTFRADIDYATAEANTTYGVIGVKVWVNRGMVFGDRKITV